MSPKRHRHDHTRRVNNGSLRTCRDLAATTISRGARRARFQADGKEARSVADTQKDAEEMLGTARAKFIEEYGAAAPSKAKRGYRAVSAGEDNITSSADMRARAAGRAQRPAADQHPPPLHHRRQHQHHQRDEQQQQRRPQRRWRQQRQQQPAAEMPEETSESGGCGNDSATAAGKFPSSSFSSAPSVSSTSTSSASSTSTSTSSPSAEPR